MAYIDSSHRELLDLWKQRSEEFEDNLDIQIFRRDAEQADSWIAMREAMLSSEDVGVSLHLYIHYTCH